MQDKTDGIITPFGHQNHYRVYFEDTDVGGIVYHANYLKFFERGRSDFLRCLRLTHHKLKEEGAVFAVTHMEIFFKSPAKHEDLICVETRPLEFEGPLCVLEQKILIEARIICETKVKLVLLDHDTLRPRRPLLVVKEAFLPYVGQKK